MRAIANLGNLGLWILYDFLAPTFEGPCTAASAQVGHGVRFNFLATIPALGCPKKA